MEKLYIFDMGGVLAQNVNILPDLTAYLGISLEEGRAWGRDLFVTLMEGKLTNQEFWAAFSQRSGLSIEKDDLFGRFFHPVLDESVHSLILKLKAQHRVVCGTNTIAEHYRIHRERGDYDVFDVVYASHLMGLAKPRVEFYQYIIEQEDFFPSQTIFIDDTVKNVEAARQLGIHSLHFTGYERLIEQLNIHPLPRLKVTLRREPGFFYSTP
jgi:putative hydrolase of the HAD superfamily